jgi:hypothetical protein
MKLKPEACDASDESRLACGWRQQVTSCGVLRGTETSEQAPQVGWAAPFGAKVAPGPAGLWRLHASGVWVRWVVAS